jgi:hypothetical protein
MTDLSRKLARLETLVSAKAPSAPTFWTPARIEGYRSWVERLLDTMPYERAAAMFTEMTTVPADQWGSVARRLDHMARMGAEGRYNSHSWPYWADRAIALPEAVCALLEAHPDASFMWDFSCEDCGLEVPHRSHVSQADAALLTICPLCEGVMKHCGYTHRQYRETWERQKAEMNAGR